VIRNNPQTPDAPIPPSTLQQAGTMAVAASSAWDSKAGMSAWWVNADQVSKSTDTGEFLPAGSFMVRGKKNFLPPAVLLLGFAVMFQISDQSKAKHVKHRIQDAISASGSETAIPKQSVQESQSPEDSDDGGDSSGEDVLEEGNEEETLSSAARANPLQSSGAKAKSDKEDEDDDDDDDETHEDSNGQSEADLEKETINIEKFKLSGSLTEAGVKPIDAAVTNGASEEEADGSTQEATSETVKSWTPAPSTMATEKQRGPAPLPRGKKSKAKKIASKYKYQDEEDRLAAQTLIGAAAGREKAEVENKARAAREAEAAFQKERRRAQHQRTQEQTAKNEEIRKLMLEDGIETPEDDEAEKMTALDEFVGTALPGDEILEAIPVCAPWAALGKYKYKVKLQPGAQKKGKAVKEILGRWTVDIGGKVKMDEESRDTERVWPREMELLRAWKAEECINVVPVSKVRVMVAGGMAGAAAAGKGDKGKGGRKGGKGKGGR
jgi:hypothetical protein